MNCKRKIERWGVDFFPPLNASYMKCTSVPLYISSLFFKSSQFIRLDYKSVAWAVQAIEGIPSVGVGDGGALFSGS